MAPTTTSTSSAPLLSFNSKLDGAGTGMMYSVFDLVVQTAFFGMYTILVFFATRSLLERKLKTRVNKVMFGIITFMYLLSAVYWAYSVAEVVDLIRSFINLAKNPAMIQPDHTAVTQWSPLFNALTLLNYVLSDGIVVWRAWIICRRDHRKYLWITIIFLVLTTLTVFLTIIFRVIGTIRYPIVYLPTGSYLLKGINVLQVTTLGTSLLSNLTATGAVGATAWGHWQTMSTTFSPGKSSTLRTSHILLLLVESGVLYCLSAILVLLSSLIRLPLGPTLGDLYTPVNIQIAGAYPTIVILLVSTKQSLSESSFTEGSTSSAAFNPGPMPSEPIRFVKEGSVPMSTTPSHRMHFASNPALSIVSATESVLSSPESIDTFTPRPLPRLPGEKDGRNCPSDDSFV
ncbi:hypothetical protein B0H16DRAFT_1903136 [Mycena metata]|uniref:Uncharacterized protein n=1 Tax=Mycena metata TaxID=1033252 RepID=A0AAD7DWU7_9AGAR|nr:hypothetical protein B0H16DRAFT_1903136 [Mycena metata]